VPETGRESDNPLDLGKREKRDELCGGIFLSSLSIFIEVIGGGEEKKEEKHTRTRLV